MIPADLLPDPAFVKSSLDGVRVHRRHIRTAVLDEVAALPESSTSGPGLRDGIRERPSTWPPDSGDTVENRNLPAAPPEVGDDPASSDGSTATRGPAAGTGESPDPTSPHAELADELACTLALAGFIDSDDDTVHQLTEWAEANRAVLSVSILSDGGAS